MVHLFMALSDSKTADGITIQIQLRNTLRMVDTYIIQDRTLIDTKQHLMFIDRILPTVQLCHFLLTAYQPARGARHGVFHITSFGKCRRTLIKRHGDR